MKKKIQSIVFIALVTSVIFFTMASVQATNTLEGNSSSIFAFSSQSTVTWDDSVGRGETDWFTVEAEPGLMQLSISWGNSYDIDCYICTSASTSNYLARGYTTNNPETCSYNIQTAGTYYIGVKMYSYWASTTAYTGELTYYADDGTSDTTAPSVAITAPLNGVSVQNTITISATASDSESGMDKVQCKLDSGSWTDDTSSPYSWTWDTTQSTDGSHTITVRAYDVAGNYVEDSVTVVVNNGGTPSNELFSGVPVTGYLAAQYDTFMYTMQVSDEAISMETILTCGSADFDVYGRFGAEPTTSSYDWRGYTSGGEEVTFNNPAEGTWYIMVRSYSGTGNYELTVTIEEEQGPSPDAEKIAVFFWASDAGAQWIIDEYWNVLQGEGYTKIFNFRDTYNFASDFATVDAYVGAEDTVFMYLFGHGNNNGVDSYTAFRPSGSFVYSSDFRTMMDGIDTVRKAYLIESCHSGGFPIDFQASPYLAMSTSDEDHNAYAVGNLPNEGVFSNAFFNHVDDGYNAVDSFNYARQIVFNGASSDTYMQYPLISDYSSYVWFN
ncbi:hypothetical protein NEF87_003669 [Candidatus Lokiarchaeum ossiferum]|uniref:Peptidase C-terminal archaeal/bacterial domain-containing protein n=1 Tax=Candidatus Lokiarchaeum ossiferum TaxID=2951803 RepID=A0ABY6HY70_9ARCH|nr:hypothetical protein NEF87_003669 [Candidatus Lokiarchaeum sp. B-35]